MSQDPYNDLKRFYDTEYYGAAPKVRPLPWHYRTIAHRLGAFAGKRVLDVACGTGDWLGYLKSQGAAISGIDISERAIAVCKQRFPDADFRLGASENLPFDDAAFDFVSCLGSIEHFVDPVAALREMRRVARGDARFLFLVPNAGFLPRRLGWYVGTQQVRVREVVRSLPEWEALFAQAGFRVATRWRDLHVLNAGWILQNGALAAPLRLAQALLLPLWPMRWQYQVHHVCTRA